MTLKNYLKKAQKEKWAIGQFNFSTIEQLRGILAAARALKSPVILGTSEGESRFLGLEETVALVEISKSKNKVLAFLNLDHGKDFALLKEAVDIGYSSVHFDGSDLAIKKNISAAKKIAEYGHKYRVLVEGELGAIRGSSEIHKNAMEIKESDLTSPGEVQEFVKKTKIDSLAVAIGNSHGLYKENSKILDIGRLKEIRKKTEAFLVLHGGSGTALKEIKKAIASGIVKVNINTESRLAWRKGLENYFQKNPDEIKPYKILPEIQDIIQKKTEEWINLLGSKNKL